MSYSILSKNDLLTLATPSNPKLTFVKLVHVHQPCGHASQHKRVKVFYNKNNLLTPVTPNGPDRTITFVQGVKLMHMHKSSVNAIKDFITFW